ncbi:transcription factor MYB88-like [Zingiber officinale]|uniref:transcription factor MYB88-like n=1 Tax=Zingiber officinale TaxID=94328 RepID=UPI001C4CFD53|nr:transcription factor MYB88-like [Zingiber officinale]
MFGNRWTEIAKVVSGRTDNAVKNRFSTLCKKRAKFEASSKENSVPSLDPSNKRVLVEEPSIAILIGEPSTSNKQMGYHISPLKETIEAHRRSLGEHGPAQHLQRPPLLEVQNFDTVNQSSASNKVSQATFLGRDDPKLTSLLQQAKLLTTLSKKVNAENTNQSLDEAWKELQEYLIQTEDSGLLRKRIANFVIRLLKYQMSVGMILVGWKMSRGNCKRHLKDDSPLIAEDNGAPINDVAEYERPKKVLILMSDTSGGHRASAKAIRAAFNQEFGDEYQRELKIFYLLTFSLIVSHKPENK